MTRLNRFTLNSFDSHVAEFKLNENVLSEMADEIHSANDINEYVSS